MDNLYFEFQSDDNNDSKNSIGLAFDVPDIENGPQFQNPIANEAYQNY
jgi:hypothetical protein